MRARSNTKAQVAQAHKCAELLTVGVPWDRRCQEVNIFASLFHIPVSMETELTVLLGMRTENPESAHTRSHTQAE